MGLHFVTNSKDLRAPREATRLAGTLKGLGVAAIAAALVTTGSFAQADVFGGPPSAQANDQMLQRLQALEGEMRALKESAPQGAAVGPGDLNLPVPPGGVAGAPSLVPKTYRVVGEVNGRFLIRAGATRLLLTKDELAKYELEEAERARMAATAGLDTAATSAASSKPMPPPPVPPVKAKPPTTATAAPAAPASAAPKAATNKPAASKTTPSPAARN